MRAEQAIRSSRAGKTAAMQREAAQLREKERKDRKNQRWELRVQLPKFMREIYAAIKAATARGEFKAEWSVNYHLEWKTRDAIKDRLERKGFRAFLNTSQGEENMGDFNAPCNVSWSRTSLLVSWDKK